MNEKVDEITKRKKIRKILLLKINDELKEISQSKPTLLINSKTIQEIEKIYNRNNILLCEKGIIYSNYIKTETKIYPPSIKPIIKFKSVDKKIDKNKIKLEINGQSYDEEVISPILNFIPKKKNLYSKKAIEKRYTKNNGWKNCFTKFRKLKAGDFMTINFKNGDLKYSINDVSLGSSIHIDDSNKSGDPYLFVHVRNDRSKAEIIYISEIFN